MHDFKLLLLKLRRLLLSRGRSLDDTDDLIQEAFLRLHLYCQEHQVEKPEAFLVRTALNLAADLKKRERTATATAETLQRLQVEDHLPAADEVYSGQERLLRMKEGIERLSPRRREVFLMNRVEGYSFSQIAERLGITVSSVEKHVAKSALLLTDWMREEEDKSKGRKK